jgi:hypothetical protein
MRNLWIALVMALMPVVSSSETYQNIGPLDTLGDIKARFPQAQFKRSFPAWAQKADAMYQITGAGLSGTIVVMFDDSRPRWRQMLEENPEAEGAAVLKKLADESDDAALTVDWVRWVPDYPIPLQRFVSRYGPPEKNGYAEGNMRPFRDWISKGVTVYLTDDEKQVMRVDYSFTREEYRQAYRKRHGFVPDWLRYELESPTPPKKGK